MDCGFVDTTTKFDSSDFRATFPRFASEARKANLDLVDLLKNIRGIKERHTRPDHGWLLAQKAVDRFDPSTAKLHRLDDPNGS
jgi:hypothetical protein